MLAIAIDSEYRLNLDMYKVLKMIALHELEETIMKDFTIRDNISKAEKKKLGKKCVLEATDGLIKQQEMVDLGTYLGGPFSRGLPGCLPHLYNDSGDSTFLHPHLSEGAEEKG